MLVDYDSDWIEFDQMKNQTTAKIIDLMQRQLTRWVIPDEIVTAAQVLKEKARKTKKYLTYYDRNAKDFNK